MGGERPETILVTGGRGFIGRHLVRQLLRSNEVVVSVDVKRPSARRVDEGGQIEIEVDVRDAAELRRVFGRFEFKVVFDLACIAELGLEPSMYLRNVEMTKSVLECVLAFEVPKYLFFSSQLVFRKEGALPIGERDYFAVNAYGAAKIQSEQLIRSMMPDHRWLILRPTYVWGEGNLRFRDGFLYRLAKGQLMIPAAKSAARYYGYVGTVCQQAEVLSSRRFGDLPCKVLYLSDPPIPMQAFCDYFLAALGCGMVWRVPGSAIRGLGRIGDAVARIGLPFPINRLQADEMTRSFPVPAEQTLRLTNISTDYSSAVAAVTSWALSDDEFRRRIRR